MSDHPPGRLAAIDYGTVRIGVAVSNASQTLASPYEIFTRRAKDAEAGYFPPSREYRKHHAVRRAACPCIPTGARVRSRSKPKSLAAGCRKPPASPVDYFDERFYETAAAEEILQAQGLTKQRRKERLDKLAAQILLTSLSGIAGARRLPFPRASRTRLMIAVRPRQCVAVPVFFAPRADSAFKH